MGAIAMLRKPYLIMALAGALALPAAALAGDGGHDRGDGRGGHWRGASPGAAHEEQRT
jgi:hypothetical protein